MALRNLNFDSAIRGILSASTSAATGMLMLATDQLAKCGLKADLAKAVAHPATHRRGPDKGKFKGSECYNERGILDWIENVPEVVPDVVEGDAVSKELHDAVAAAHVNLVRIHATLAARNPTEWDKIKAGVKPEPKPLA